MCLRIESQNGPGPIRSNSATDWKKPADCEPVERRRQLDLAVAPCFREAAMKIT
jgi:hypothetical protein